MSRSDPPTHLEYNPPFIPLDPDQPEPEPTMNTVLAAFISDIDDFYNSWDEDDVVLERDTVVNNSFDLCQLEDVTVDQLVQPDMDCSICLKIFKDLNDEPETVKSLPCSHVFHGDCIRRWLAVKQDCPLCRRPLVRTLSY
ncbi:RING finger protein 145 [Linum perenne]